MNMFKIWFGANFIDKSYYRYRYIDGSLTQLISFKESVILKEVFGGDFFIDYDYILGKGFFRWRLFSEEKPSDGEYVEVSSNYNKPVFSDEYIPFIKCSDFETFRFWRKSVPFIAPRFTTVSFDCFNQYVSMIIIDNKSDMITLECISENKIHFSEKNINGSSYIRIGDSNISFDRKSHIDMVYHERKKTYGGSWVDYSVLETMVVVLLNKLMRSGNWACSSGPSLIYDKFNKGMYISMEDFKNL